MSVIYALDFDGVICDSVGESSISAFRAARRVFPSVFTSSVQPSWWDQRMRQTRPIIETGYENIVVGRRLYQAYEAGENVDQVVENILKNWFDIRGGLIAEFGVDKQTMIEAFGAVRDEWIQTDLDAWIAANRAYPGVVDALNKATSPLYVLTTKQTRFVVRLLEAFGVRSIPEENIYGLGSGSKISILKQLLAKPEAAGKTVYFVEDRFETIDEATLSLLGLPIEYYFAEWGYSTDRTKQKVVRNPVVNTLSLDDFCAKLQ